MANIDPLETLVADGRLRVRQLCHYGLPDVLTIDLDVLRTNINTRLAAIFTNCTRLRQQYGSSFVHANNQITLDTANMADYLAGQVYNRLRNILEAKYPTVRSQRMNTRCPIPAYMEFPRWVVSVLSCIGPCRVEDGPDDKLVVFATTQATMNNYGRAAAVVFNEGGYARLISALKAINVECTSFPPIQTTTPSYYPLLYPEDNDGTWMIYGTVHSSHFENEDVARIAFVSSDAGVTPFPTTGMTIGYVDNEATLTALAAVAAPEGIPAGQDADSAGRPVALAFPVNYYGIQPGVAAAGAVPARARGMYVIGRGTRRYYQFQFAHSFSVTEINELMRHRLLGSIYG